MLRSALSFSAALVAATPAVSANYSATLAGPTQGRIVAREINWACAGNTCQGTTQESRAAVLCQALAKRAGHIDTFLVDGRPFSAADLDKCNSVAKAGPGKAIAVQ